MCETAPFSEAAVQEDMSSPRAETLLNKLRSLPGVTGVNTKPVKPANKPNCFGVSFLLQPPGASRTSKRSAVTGPDGERPTFIIAVESAIAWASARLAEHGVDVGCLSSVEPAPPTQEEMEWLAEWLDEPPAPETIGAEELTAALMQRRSASASSQAGSSSTDSSGFSRLYEVQLQRAQLRAAEKPKDWLKSLLSRCT